VCVCVCARVCAWMRIKWGGLGPVCVWTPTQACVVPDPRRRNFCANLSAWFAVRDRRRTNHFTAQSESTLPSQAASSLQHAECPPVAANAAKSSGSSGNWPLWKVLCGLWLQQSLSL